jgi:pyrroline-5-carboxylate reductase
MENTKITFIGCGNMGSSLIGGLLANGYPADLITGVDPSDHQRALLKEKFSVQIYADSEQALKEVKVVVLAVKPQSMKETIEKVRKQIILENPLLLSIAAGIRINSLNQWFGKEMAIARVMPNTPALIGSGAAGMYANHLVDNAQKKLTESIMASVGTAIWVENEDLIDAVTALSGSGPAYFFLINEVIQKAAIKLGLSESQARILSVETARGAAEMLAESGADAATLRQQVTSPGGTTEQALKVLINGNIDQLFARALTSARDRSIELADTFGSED